MRAPLQTFPVRRALALSLGILTAALSADAQDERRHRDARQELNRSFSVAASDVQEVAIANLAAQVNDLAAERDETLGTVRTLSSRVGYLTEARPGDDALAIALDFVRAHRVALGLTERDLLGYEITDRVYSDVTGATHLYLRQRHLGIPVYNGQLHINVNRDGRVISVNNSFVPDLAGAVRRTRAALGVENAVLSAARDAGLAIAGTPRRLGEPRGLDQATSVDASGISRRQIEGRLMWLPLRQGQVELVWNFQIETPDGQHFYDYTVSAGPEGAVWTRVDWTAGDQYTVYAQPVESPNHTSPLPPADGRTVVTNPANAIASPYGWHDTNGAAGAEYTIMRGNNVHAYEDRDFNNAPPTSQPSCGASLLCNFSIDLTQAPSAYIPAAVANLFYWNNIIHDIQYQYGFNEAAGNFQQNNYGRGGLGNDYVQAEAQDGGGTNNANFSTPADGSRPRMQMYLWTAPNPDKDGDLDNGIIVHEYGHGISNRLVGGPSNVSCLGNSQQPGEGLSDWWALVYTAKAGDTGPMGRGIGTYALNQPTTGVGIRTQRYSTDPAVNTWTYASINGMAIPHGVGSVWAQAAWEMYWKLVDHWGFDANLYNATGSAGNQRAMLYVNEGLKNTVCSPTFVNVRDGIIQAATDNHGGVDVCRLWEAFAAFGLGVNAVSGGPNSTSPTNGFNLPAQCGGGGSTTVFFDDFETNKGWTVNPSGTDTATTGKWERGDPESTNSSGPKQLGTTVSGVNDLVTGRLAGSSAGAHDIDGGVTSIRSPNITLPSTGTLTLSFSYYLAHGTNSSSADFLRVKVVGSTTSTVLEELGAANNDDAVWATASVNIDGFKGQTVYILIEAADAASASLVEAAVDDVKIVSQ